MKRRNQLNERWVQNQIADDPSILGREHLVLKDKMRNHPRARRQISVRVLIVTVLALVGLVATASCKGKSDSPLSERPADTVQEPIPTQQPKPIIFSDADLPLGSFGLEHAKFGSTKEVLRGLLNSIGIDPEKLYIKWEIDHFQFAGVKNSHFQLSFEEGYGFSSIRLRSEDFSNFDEVAGAAKAYSTAIETAIGKPIKIASASLSEVQSNDYQIVRKWNNKQLEADVVIHELIDGNFRVKASVTSKASKPFFEANWQKTSAELEAVRNLGSTNRLSCYEIGYRFGKCATLSMKGKVCAPQDDISVPTRCRNNAETQRGISDGTRSVY